MPILSGGLCCEIFVCRVALYKRGFPANKDDGHAHTHKVDDILNDGMTGVQVAGGLYCVFCLLSRGSASRPKPSTYPKRLINGQRRH